MEALVTILVGHRGVGKTTFLNQLSGYASAHGHNWSCLDLDEAIAHYTGRTIADILGEDERRFRSLEKEVLSELVRASKQKTFIAVGAGFEGPVPSGVHVIWLRRSTDAHGRVFGNRPRLDSSVPPLDEYLQRYPERTARYQKWAHEQLILPEGLDDGLASFVDDSVPQKLPYALTILPENIRDWKSFWGKRKDWKLRYVEWRDDIHSKQDWESIGRNIPGEQLLYSCRRPEAGDLPRGVRIDWALELGTPPNRDVHILSLHHRGSSLHSCFGQLSSAGADIKKLAVEIHDFKELREGHEWWLQSPSQRAFLPRSADGRWRWYRSLFGPKMPLHFFREGEGSSLDQPFLWQTVLQPEFDGSFAAVLGSPVEHSRTPVEHRSFFKMPVVAIGISEEEFGQAIPILRELGLKAAAVTSPLKIKAKDLATICTPEAELARAANTLWFSGHTVHAHNTDLLALQDLQKQFSARTVWLWGGGGVKAAVKAAWPELKEVSARRGTDEAGELDLLIWAVGRGREFVWPSLAVQPKQILDLNYTEDSPGLEWALARGIPYHSGLNMFKLQAEYQRRFWRERGAP